jgi:hypothetical protein
MEESCTQGADTNGTIHIHPPTLVGVLLLGGPLLHLLSGHHHRVLQLQQLLGLLSVAAG